MMLAEDFLQAGSRLSRDLKLFVTSMPAYFLFGHAIELAFKSFLMACGASDKCLRGLGHDLVQLVGAADAEPTFNVHLADRQREALRWFSPYYNGKHLEYLSVGATRLPLLPELEGVANAVLYGVKPIVESAVLRAIQSAPEH